MDKKPTKKPKVTKKASPAKTNLSFEEMMKLAATTVVKNRKQKN